MERQPTQRQIAIPGQKPSVAKTYSSTNRIPAMNASNSTTAIKGLTMRSPLTDFPQFRKALGNAI